MARRVCGRRYTVQKLSTLCTKQNLGQEHCMLSFVTTHSSFTKSVMMSFIVSEMGVIHCRTWSAKSVDAISYYFNRC